MSDLEIPPEVVRTNLAAEGESGRAWLDSLPSIVSELRRRWSLRLGPAFQGGVVGFVAPGERDDDMPVVLKVSLVTEETRGEADALRAWNGDGAVLLLDEDPSVGALLLERLDPGTSLEEHPDRNAAIGLASALLKRLWRPPPPEHSFPLVRDLAASWAEEIPARFEQLGRPFEASLAREAALLCEEFSASSDAFVLANRDYHLGNVLAAQREPWLAIDPKPMVGEATFDTGHFLRSLLPVDVDRAATMALVRRLANALGVDEDKVRAWAFVRSVEDALWDLRVGVGAAERHLARARMLAAKT